VGAARVAVAAADDVEVVVIYKPTKQSLYGKADALYCSEIPTCKYVGIQNFLIFCRIEIHLKHHLIYQNDADFLFPYFTWQK